MDGMISTGREPMLEMYLFETGQMLEQLEDILLEAEKSHQIGTNSVNEIFRIMHTIKGSSAMMMFKNVASLAHAVEDMFYIVREDKSIRPDVSRLCDLVLGAGDFIRERIARIESGEPAEGEATDLIRRIRAYSDELKGVQPTDAPAAEPVEEPVKANRYYISNYGSLQSAASTRYEIRVRFSEGCEMENIRAYSLVFALQEHCLELIYFPQDIISDPESSDIIAREGFLLYISTQATREEIEQIVQGALFVEFWEIAQIEEFPERVRDVGRQVQDRGRQKPSISLDDEGPRASDESESETGAAAAGDHPSAGAETGAAGGGRHAASRGNMVSVNLNKLDKLMDLVGEIVITESMVTRCPELAGLQLDAFHKSANQLRKLTDELQDIVMSIRMLPLSGTFQKMNRIVRDMCKNLKKDADLVLLGEETEVDKNLIDQLADPLMHLVRNAMDHGIETPAERRAKGKPERAQLTLSASNEGGEIRIQVRDDGKGLNRARIIEKARENGLTAKTDAELTDREIFGFVMLPGFSTKEAVTEFSGRGVGMDVVRENIMRIGGSITLDSQPDQGTTVTIRIPLTLAIIDGMLVAVGKARYIIPITAIHESFRSTPQQVISDADGNELIMLRGECHPVVRLHRRFGVATEITSLEEGIVIVVDSGGTKACLFADELIGEQQVVVKPLPTWFRHVSGISGCTIMGDGGISLILDIQDLGI